MLCRVVAYALLGACSLAGEVPAQQGCTLAAKTMAACAVHKAFAGEWSSFRRDLCRKHWHEQEQVRAWVGAYNSTHADQYPRNDLKPGQKPYTYTKGPCRVCGHKHCLTQIEVKLNGGKITKRGATTCTSCKPGFAFAFIYHKSRAGICQPYLSTSTVFLGALNADSLAGAEDKALVATKMLKAAQGLQISKLNREAQQHFSLAQRRHTKGWTKDWVRPICLVRKETICSALHRSKQTACKVRKSIICDKVCRYNRRCRRCRYRCWKSLCRGRYSTLACRKAALME